MHDTIPKHLASEYALILSIYKRDCALLDVHYTMQDNKFICDNLKDSIRYYAKRVYELQEMLPFELVSQSELQEKF